MTILNELFFFSKYRITLLSSAAESSDATRLSYLASLAPEERWRNLVDFHVTYARGIKPPAKKKTPLTSKKVPHASNTNNLDQPESIPNKRGRKKLPRDSNGKIIRK